MRVVGRVPLWAFFPAAIATPIALWINAASVYRGPWPDFARGLAALFIAAIAGAWMLAFGLSALYLVIRAWSNAALDARPAQAAALLHALALALLGGYGLSLAS